MGFPITINKLGSLITIATSHRKHRTGTQPSFTVLLFRSKIGIKIFRSTKTKSIPDRDKLVSSRPLLLSLSYSFPVAHLEKSVATTEIELSGSVSDIIHVLTENIYLWGNFVAPPPAPDDTENKCCPFNIHTPVK